MRIVRLSRASPIPPPTGPLKKPLSAPPQPPESKLSRTLALLTAVLLPPLLALTLTLTLLPLLLPTVEHTSLSFFSVEPIGHARELGVVALNGSSNAAIDEGESGVEGDKDDRSIGGRQSETGDNVAEAFEELDDFDDEETIDIVENGSTMEWMGKDGPKIYVGALQICSKNQSHPKAYCTSSSLAESHTGLLPPSLARSLLALPTSPRTPILLLVSAILSIIATFVFLAGLIPWDCSPTINSLRRKLPLKSEPHRSYADAEAGSIRKGPGSPLTLRDSKSCIKQRRPHGAFFCLIVVALGLATGALIELKDVHDAKEAWNDEDARAVGMVFQLGALTYILPCLPLCLILILIVASSSMIHTLYSSIFHKCPADQDFPLVSARPVIKISPPAEGPLTNGSADTPIDNPTPEALPLSVPVEQTHSAEGQGRRNTFGTGQPEK
ncbi:hypothetical protein IAU59_006781 [Kwoniella sp. CBS 9459]